MYEFYAGLPSEVSAGCLLIFPVADSPLHFAPAAFVVVLQAKKPESQIGSAVS